MSAPTCLVLFHTMDPRGSKLGGIETHVRLLLSKHPETISILFVGIDELGDCVLGQVRPVEIGQRRIDFLPVAHVPAERINKAAKKIWRSTTLRFTLGALRYLGRVKGHIAVAPTSAEIERFEFALLPKLLGLPFVLIVHNEGSKEDKMDSLLKRLWFLHLFNERVALQLASRVFAVNDAIAARVAGLSPRFAAKTQVMSVSVDTDTFRASPFPSADDAFHVCFAGRLDDFKDPPLMFESLALLSSRLVDRPIGRFKRVVFDYVGASDPGRFPEYAAIASVTNQHGIRRADEVAGIMRGAHVGIITSFFEGMPCYLLEMLASGRPTVAVSLPQFTSLIVPGVSGRLVAREATREASAAVVAGALCEVAEEVDAGSLDTEATAALAWPYAVKTQMRRLFDAHEQLACHRFVTHHQPA